MTAASGRGIVIVQGKSMNRQSLLFPLLFAVVAVAGCKKSDEQVVADAKAELVSGCKESSASIPGVAPDKIDGFCTCMADNVVTALGPDGIRAAEDKGEMTTELQEMAQQSTLACVDKLGP